ncbi:YoaK family protein [Francisella philomiragia]|uniref:DUF1275 domain-containing protein n=1 Tax=Francisella philomiragia TaxID=28110 RepID=A0A0B6D4U8_9GAMM|nr:YoaK family protein [Francisella philomiragia]AJI53886.1 hypothetical protein LA55_286 [Francisella philomiragia]
MKNTIKQPSLWVYLSAILLPVNGGLINVITLMSFLHNSVGYVTGNISNASIYLHDDDLILFCRMILLILFFLFGAVTSSLITCRERFEKDIRYVFIILIQLICITVAIILLRLEKQYSDFVLAFLMGAQNAMTTHYGTAIIRTTHMTGTTTDLGISIARWLKYRDEPVWKIKLYLVLILSFIGGSILGAILFRYYGVNVVFISILIYLILLAKYYLRKLING